MHAFLHSELIDSVNSYITQYGIDSKIYRPIYRNKFLASHILEFSPIDGIDIALGESNVYGNRSPELIFNSSYVFKAAEHYTVDLDNNQLFGTYDINYFKNYNFYGTLFIDEFSTDEFLREDRQRNQIGYTLGSRIYDLGFENSRLIFEFTVNPWAYNHKYPDATYQSHNVDLGHWIGQNAQNIFIKYTFQPKRNLQVSALFDQLEKGGKLPNTEQYKLPTPKFLYGQKYLDALLD